MIIYSVRLDKQWAEGSQSAVPIHERVPNNESSSSSSSSVFPAVVSCSSLQGVLPVKARVRVVARALFTTDRAADEVVVVMVGAVVSEEAADSR